MHAVATDVREYGTSRAMHVCARHAPRDMRANKFTIDMHTYTHINIHDTCHMHAEYNAALLCR